MVKIFNRDNKLTDDGITYISNSIRTMK